MSTLAAPRAGDAPPISYLNAWWGLVHSFLVGVIILTLAWVPLMLLGHASGLPLGPPGGSQAPLSTPSDLIGWPLDPSLLWFRVVDLFVLASTSLWLGRRLRDRFLFLDVRLRMTDSVLSVGGLMVIAALSHWAGVVATFVIAGLLRRVGGSPVPAATGPRLHWKRWFAAAWAVAILGGLVVVNAVPVAAEPGSSCDIGAGTVQPPPGTSFGAGQPPVRYAFRPGGTFAACAAAHDRAWFTSVRVLGIDPSELPARAPWTVELVTESDNPRSLFTPIGPFSLAPRGTRDLLVLIRFTSCAGRHGRTFSLSGVPLRVRAYGHAQTDLVRFSQPVQTTCPY